MANNPDRANTQDPAAISDDDRVIPFPGAAIGTVSEPDVPTDDEIIERLSDLVDRWCAFGQDVRRRMGGELPGDLHLELCELLRECRT